MEDERKITVTIKEEGIFYDSDLSLEQVVFWLQATINLIYSNVFEKNTNDTE